MTVPNAKRLTLENFESQIFRFRDRQAGVSLIYDPERQVFSYNAYCLETKLVKELYTCEFDFLDDALALINDEFGTWELGDIAPAKAGCGSCAAH